MDTPQPVDLNKLKALLGNAKKIMTKVENNDFTTGNVDARALTEDGVREMQAEGIVRPARTAPTEVATDYTDEMVMNSKLPPAIKKAMMEKKIPRLEGPTTSTFSLEDVADMVEKPMGYPKTPVTLPKKLNEGRVNSAGSDLITISRAQLDEIINARLLEYLTNSYNKNLTEETIKRTINMLIKEGKLTVKKK